MDAMSIFDTSKMQLMLIIDEAQVLAYAEHAHFAHALRAALDIRKDRIKVIFAVAWVCFYSFFPAFYCFQFVIGKNWRNQTGFRSV